MKTYDEFQEDSYRAMLLMCNYLKDKGHKVEQFYNLEGDTVVSVTVDNMGEEAEYIAVFERV